MAVHLRHNDDGSISWIDHRGNVIDTIGDGFNDDQYLIDQISTLAERVAALETNTGSTQQTLPGQIQLEAATLNVNEGGSATIRINRVGGSDGTVDCVLTITGATVDTQYTSSIASGTVVTFGAGVTQRTLTFTSVSGGISSNTNVTLTLGTFRRNGASDATVEGVRSTMVVTMLDVGGGGTGATYDYYISSTATNGSGTVTDPWSMDQLLANPSVPPGSVVGAGPGVYRRPNTGSRWTPAFKMASEGTAGNPIIIRAQYKASALTDTSPNRSILEVTGTYDASGNTGCPVMGAENQDYIIWDGFFVNEANTMPRVDSGVAVLYETTGSEIQNCRFIGITGQWSNNHCQIRMENSTAVKALDNVISGNRTLNNHGDAVIIYGCQNYEVAHNRIFDSEGAIHSKGDSTTNSILNPSSIHHNLVYQCRTGILLGGQKAPSGTTYTCDVYQNVIYQSGLIGAFRFLSYDNISGNYTRLVNNTVFLSATVQPNEACIHVGNGFGTLMLENSIIQNNIIYSSNSKEVLNSYVATATGIERAAINRNCYFNYGTNLMSLSGGSYTFATWTARGISDQNSLNTNPLFKNTSTFDLRLQKTSDGDGATSPCVNTGIDVLNLKGGGTSAPINMGAYIRDDQSDIIGPRLNVPDAFSFTTQTDVSTASVITSNSVTITGIQSAVTVSVTDGEMNVNGGGWVTASTTISSGQTLQVRHTSSSANSTSTVTTVNVGGYSTTFTSTTVSGAGDTTPDAFSFTDQTGVTTNSTITSNSLNVSGITAAATVTVSGGEMNINGAGWTTTATTITNGQSFQVRHTSSVNPSTATNTILTIGGVSDTFTSTTAAASLTTISRDTYTGETAGTQLTAHTGELGTWIAGAEAADFRVNDNGSFTGAAYKISALGGRGTALSSVLPSGDDVEVTCRVGFSAVAASPGTASDNVGITLNHTGQLEDNASLNCYRIYLDGQGYLHIQDVKSGVRTQRASSSLIQFPVVNTLYHLKATRSGDVISGYLDTGSGFPGSPQVTWTDTVSPITGGRVGMYARVGVNGNNARWDDWEAKE